MGGERVLGCCFEYLDVSKFPAGYEYNTEDGEENFPMSGFCFAGLISLGIYRFLTLFLLNIFRKSKWFKKYILGAYYLEGTWVGFFIGNENRIRYFVETFEQDLNSLVIRGKSFKDEGAYHGSWIAETSNIDIKLGKLSYNYTTDAIGNTFINPGIAIFNFERPSAQKPPNKLIGFSSDLYNPNKLKAMEIKISEDTSFETENAIQEAKKLYDANKNIF